MSTTRREPVASKVPKLPIYDDVIDREPEPPADIDTSDIEVDTFLEQRWEESEHRLSG